jgi:hypothetical protein
MNKRFQGFLFFRETHTEDNSQQYDGDENTLDSVTCTGYGKRRDGSMGDAESGDFLTSDV